MVHPFRIDIFDLIYSKFYIQISSHGHLSLSQLFVWLAGGWSEYLLPRFLFVENEIFLPIASNILTSGTQEVGSTQTSHVLNATTQSPNVVVNRKKVLS